MAKQADRLTKRALDEVRRQTESNPEFSSILADGGQPGLYVRARRGRVRFVFRYSPPGGGRRRQMQIDDYGAITLEQARRTAQEHRAQVARGIDPQEVKAEQQREEFSVKDGIEGYLRDLEDRSRSLAGRGKRSGYASARRRLEKHILPRLGGMPMRDVEPEDLQRIRRAMKSTPVEANRTISAFSAVFGWADRERKIPAGTNPTQYVDSYVEDGRRRAFTDDELGALGEALFEAEEDGRCHRSVILAVKLLALTGFRRAEVVGHTMKNRRGPREGLRWGDVDLERGLVTLRETKAGSQVRTIGQAAIDLLAKNRPKGAGASDCVCPGVKPGKPFVGIDKARQRLWQAASLEDVDLHSLRHTFASVGAHVDQGRYVGMVSALLGHGHQSRSITERYITSNPEALRPAADAISGRLAELMDARLACSSRSAGNRRASG